jgi:hypothetical protein
MYSHCEKVHSFPEEGLTVSKKSSYWTWNCGETNPVSSFSTRFTDLACRGEGPRLMPSLALGFHLGIALPSWRQELSAKTGQPNVWLCLNFGRTSVRQNLSRDELPSSLSAIVFRMSFALQSADGHRLILIADGHLAFACRSCFLACSERLRIRFSTMPFWKWALTPQKEIVYPNLATTLRKRLSVKQPLSAW